jgi:methylated-DNA-protein-cysteine methyltransferase-like protein
MFSVHWVEHWDKIFWLMFLIIGASLITGTMAGLLPFEYLVIMGLFIVIIGAGKLGDEVGKHKLLNYQDDVYKKVYQLSQQLEHTFNLTSMHVNKTEFRLQKLDQRRKEAETRAEKNYRDLARKLIEMENRMNKVSRIMVEREVKRFDLGKEMEFSESVLSLVKQIPRGKVTTYSEIAKTAGKPKAAKAIGKILSSNAHLKTIPFHRVVKSNGKVILTGNGSRKRTSALRKEGVRIEKGRIDMDRHMFEFVPKI